ncbi:hypothetical protein QE363_001918 [Sphingomonas sp. SORGH_AS870]|uniref:spike base protein, RCAP_Rcc01079 family n=1 Tax=Sphingomonas sp. SORGH_AS_0870 TaxID=3041801 RepID=UPI00285DFE65|nr:hypothetical protein [Sphingomonas sp. SORGH_AS_0870]MDR6146125.1 hypothetical protein [Sphingomonas sp. SORGH_AS_0870]
MAYNASQYPNTPSSSVKRTAVITPSDTASILATKSIFVVSGGTVVLKCSEDSTAQTFANLPAFTELTFEVVAVLATGTTATDIRACY